MLDFIRVATAVPPVTVGDAVKNAEDICKYIALADEKGELPFEHCADPYGLAVHPSYAGCAVWLEYLYTHAIPDKE